MPINLRPTTLVRLCLRALVTVAAVCLATACTEFDANRKELLSARGSWTIFTIGNVDTPPSMYGTTVVEFSALHDGRQYASGRLYEAGSHDHTFSVRFPEREWILANTLRLSYVPPRALPRTAIEVRNETGAAIRWLTISTDELFLSLSIRPRSKVSFETRRWSDALSVRVQGEFESGDPISSAGASFVQDPNAVDIIIRSGTAEFIGR